MARNENPPFELGQTYFAGQTPDVNVGNQICGKVWEFEDVDLNAANTGGTAKPRRTAHTRRMMAVRNTTGSALLPKRLGKLKNDGSGYQYGAEIDGYADALTELGFPIDEFLPAAGVADDDICWVCVEGPATVVTAAAGDTNIAIGAKVVPATDGKVVDQDTSVAAGAATFNQVNFAVGRAMKAVNATDTDLVIYVDHKY